ncbi:hypothetical protein HY061_02920 [Candidatus Azambacteria bacterium]|nr:hypothetical protein [Candidatus Azambacteria bacterium]
MENNQEQLNNKEKYDQQRKDREQKRLNSDRVIKVKKVLKVILVLIVVFLAGHWIYLSIRHSNNNKSEPATNREVALRCTTDMATKFHIHPNLEIIANGQKQEISANIGIIFNCMNPLHTHDRSGLIHIESPEKRDFTLSDFFAVWGKTYNKNQILDYRVDANHIIRQTVNGQEVVDFENTILYDKDQIIISYEQKK